jgi:hypothetical protein
MLRVEAFTQRRIGEKRMVPLQQRVLRVFVGLILVSAPPISAEAVMPLVRAHSHNDYNRPRPLWDAVDQGFCSVETDIWLVDSTLLVGHERKDLKPDKTLEELYLKPLLERVRANEGRVYPGGPSFFLLIDFKSDEPETYYALRRVLEQYREMLTEFRKDDCAERGVTVILSGSVPKEIVLSDTPRLCAVDGRLEDLDGNSTRYEIPWISASWLSVFRWTGRGEMPKEEKARLQEIVAKAHAQGRRVRFWNLPVWEHVWKTVYDAGVDLLNTDNPAALAAFLRAQETKTKS